MIGYESKKLLNVVITKVHDNGYTKKIPFLE